MLFRKVNFLSWSLKKRDRKNTLGPHYDTDLESCVLVWGFVWDKELKQVLWVAAYSVIKWIPQYNKLSCPKWEANYSDPMCLTLFNTLPSSQVISLPKHTGVSPLYFCSSCVPTLHETFPRVCPSPTATPEYYPS